MKIALVPGSFDPMTTGHLAIVRRALKLFDRVVVAVLNNADKKYTFSLDERVQIALRTVAQEERVTVVYSDGYLVDLASSIGACALVKGLRNREDFEYELAGEEYNRSRLPEVETVYLRSAPEFEKVSSTEARRLLAAEADTSGILTPAAAEYIRTLR